jgi:cephalosporin hydroxylase
MTTADPVLAFRAEVEANITRLHGAEPVHATSARWLRQTHDLKYDYNFTWFGRPVLQLPQDLMALQELVFTLRPDRIVETGIAHGGSLVFFASLLHLLDRGGRVLGIDVDIRAHNRRELDAHPMRRHIDLLQGSSIAADTLAAVRTAVGGAERVMVVLDSDHTEAHVLAELRAYAPLVTQGSYLVVCDTIVEDLGADACPDRPWGPGNSPKSAVAKFLAECPDFVVDERIDAKLLLSNSPGGYLRRVR